MNRLARERSPYLLQHADNPVDWYPWGQEAFDRARAEDKPIFLSIGYSTCHWCHVMAHESFENDAVAAVVNEFFVPVKVDREERPDVDRVYMTFVQATTGSGGWPMSVWLTPDLKPFFGGTYFPPQAKYGRPGFLELLQQIGQAWRERRDAVQASADSVAAQLIEATAASAAAGSAPSLDALPRTVAQLREAFDHQFGGFGRAPKFPRPTELLFLMREYSRTGSTDARDMALRTLAAMAGGGVRDHVGGGFHRYAVDAAWRVPHFEKMLYDQAQLVLAYLEGAQVSNDRFLLDVAEDTLDYVLREMTDDAGGFYSAEDADSLPPERAGDPAAHASEGAFYLWRAAELDALLGDDAPLVRRRFGVEAAGNAPVDPQQEFVGRNLLYVAHPIEALSAEFGRTEQDVMAALDAARQRLFEVRSRRPRPHRDDKILTAWNGLMIAAFARASRLSHATAGDALPPADTYLRAATQAADFIRSRMWNADSGTLRRRYRDGDAAIDGYAEDYACLIFGLLELFQADARPEWLEWAVALQHEQDRRFWDETSAGWFNTPETDAAMLLRLKDDHDGAEPAASSVSVLNLLRLTHLVHEPAWRDRVDRTLALFAEKLEQFGRGVPMMAAALSTRAAGIRQVVVVGDVTGALAREALVPYRPFSVVLVLTPDQQRALAPHLPWLAAMHPVDGQAAAYVCRDFTCRAPVTTPEALAAELA